MGRSIHEMTGRLQMGVNAHPMTPFVALRRVLNGCEVNGNPDCRLGLRLSDCAGRQGIFVEWRWDGVSITVENDRYGMYPVYYYAGRDSFVLSPSLEQIIALGAPAELDDDAIAAFLRLGWLLGEDTFFRHIRALPPNATLRWKNDGELTVESSLIPDRTDYTLSRSEAVASYIDLFRQAIHRRLPKTNDRVILPLSGGRDSRHILLELWRQRVRPSVVTAELFSTQSNQGLGIAAELCRALGASHTAIAQTSNWFSAERAKNRLIDCASDQHAWFLQPARYMLANRATATYVGIAGDTLSQSIFGTFFWQEISRTKDPTRLYKAIRGAGGGASELTRERILTRKYYARWSDEAARERVVREARRFEASENMANRFFFWSRTRRATPLCFLQLLEHRIGVHMPYLDNDLFDFLWKLPLSIVGTGDFHDEVIRRAYPEYAGVPFEPKEANPGDARALHATFARRLGLMLSAQRECPYLNTRWVIPRMLWSVLSSRYGSDTGWFAQWVLWLYDFWLLSTGARHPPRGDETARRPEPLRGYA
jgi:hypothetical protein